MHIIEYIPEISCGVDATLLRLQRKYPDERILKYSPFPSKLKFGLNVGGKRHFCDHQRTMLLYCMADGGECFYLEAYLRV